MNQSLAAAVQAANARESTPDITAPKGSGWAKVCVCGHVEAKHSEKIGGTHPHVEVSPHTQGQETVLEGCGGEPRAKNVDAVTFRGMEDREGLDRPVKVFEIPTTCPCHKFRPVLEAYDPRFRWAQRRAPRRHDGSRDPDYVKHAVFRGVKATFTGIQNLKMVQNSDISEEEKTELAGRMLEERIQWIDRRCWAKGCDETEDVWPVYLEDDHSEMRCQVHRPTA